MNTRRQSVTNSLFIVVALAVLCTVGYPQRLQESKANLKEKESASQEGNLSAQEIRTSVQSVGQQQKVVRDVYVRLMRYHTAARDEQAATTGVSYKPEDYVVFELRDMHTGPIEEIYDRLAAELITNPDREFLKVTPHHLQHGNGPKHAYYDVEWATAPSAPARGGHNMGMSLHRGETLADVTTYTSFEVTVRLSGMQRAYRALALHHSTAESNGDSRTEILDNVTSEMNTVLLEQSPRVRSPWKGYVKSPLYLAVAREIRDKGRAGLSLIPADAPIGYLPGDDAVPNSRNAQMQLATVCVAPHINSISPSRALRGTIVDVIISGRGFGSPISIDAGTGISVTIDPNFVTPSEVDATFTMRGDTPEGAHAVTVTVNGQRSDNSVTFYVQTPTSLRRDSISGVVSVTNGTINGVPNQCGAYQTLSYTLLDQQGQPIITDQPITEKFSGYNGPVGLAPQTKTVNLTSGVVDDVIGFATPAPNCPPPFQASVTQNFKVLVGLNVYPLSTTNSILLARDAAGNNTVSVTITTP